MYQIAAHFKGFLLVGHLRKGHFRYAIYRLTGFQNSGATLVDVGIRGCSIIWGYFFLEKGVISVISFSNMCGIMSSNRRMM